MTPSIARNTVGVIGLGYIGLPTAAALAQAGKTVIGVEAKQSVVDAINNGWAPFGEEGSETVNADVAAQRELRAQTETPEASSYIVFVLTPVKGEHVVPEQLHEQIVLDTKGLWR